MPVTHDPLVSILMPLYNCEKYVEESISSVIAQSWKNWELIIVNDGSTDDSKSIVESIIDPRIKLYHQNNKGGSVARNVAFSKSKGEIIQYLDADDLIDKNKIKTQLEVALANPNKIVSGVYYRFHDNILNSRFSEEIGYKNYLDSFDWVMDNYTKRTMFPPAVWLIPRKLIQKAGDWNPSLTYNDDFEFFTRLVCMAEGIIFEKNAVTYYRRGNPQSVSHRKDNVAILSDYQALYLASNYILKKRNTYEVKKEIASQYSKFIFSVYPKYKALRLKASAEIEKLEILPPQNFFNKNRLTGKLSRFIGWKTIKHLQYFLKRIGIYLF